MEQLPTPALLIDLPLMEANLTRMADFFRDRPTRLRPHFKTHKCVEIARRQIELGATGLTCAKLSEAEVLAEAGIQSILIANQVVDPLKIQRLAELARNRHMIVAVDQASNLRQISAAAQDNGSIIQVLVEVNVGLNRCGVQSGEAALKLAKLASELPGIVFSGVMGYEGHTIFEHDANLRRANVQLAMGTLTGAANLIRAACLPVEIVSGGGTGTYDMTGVFPGLTEIQTGSYVFMDTEYSQLDLPFENALFLLATVVSIPSTARAVLDCGMKALSSDNGLPEIWSPAGVRLTALHEEHGLVEVNASARTLQVGNRVAILPSHVCTTVNLHDRYYAMRDRRLEAIWEIKGRGKSQ